MKYKCLFYSLILFSCFCLAQENEKTRTFNNFLDTLRNYQTDTYNRFERMDGKNFNAIIAETYKSILLSPSEIANLFHSDIKYATVFNDLMYLIKKRYSYYIQTIIRIPIFIKAKIISSTEENKSGFRQINLTLKPKYIIKGVEPFLSKPEFTVFYREYEYVPKDKDYKIGESYLFPLWDRGEKENSIFAIATWVDGNGSRFLIKNNILFDEYNFFNRGTEIKFDDIVKEVNETILSINSGIGLDKYQTSVKHNRNQ